MVSQQTYVSKINQTVRINLLGKDFKFEEWEGLQTEQSYKYSVEKIRTLAKKSDFKVIKELYDSRKYFVVFIWEVK